MRTTTHWGNVFRRMSSGSIGFAEKALVIIKLKNCIAFTFMHLADAFIQSDLQCIQVIHFLPVGYMCSLGIEPTTFAPVNHWATGTLWYSSSKHLVLQGLELILRSLTFDYRLLLESLWIWELEILLRKHFKQQCEIGGACLKSKVILPKITVILSFLNYFVWSSYSFNTI